VSVTILSIEEKLGAGKVTGIRWGGTKPGEGKMKRGE